MTVHAAEGRAGGLRLTRRAALASLPIGAATLAAGLLASGPAAALVSLDVTQGNVAPLPIAIPNFIGGSEADAQLAADISGVVAADLKRSGLSDRKSVV